jgi:hypothetical protein
LSTLCNPTTSLLLVLLQNTDLLKSLHNFAVYTSAGINMVGWTGTTVAGGSVSLSKTTDTDGFAEVNVTGDGSSPNVKPVNGLGRKLLRGASLNGINPTWIMN